ncbi:MAG: hypothetical protein ACFFEV_09620, partial [Candidatus Thorarchaeota archaeon]
LAIAAILPAPPNDNFGNVGGFIMGLSIGLVLENRYVEFSVEAPSGQKWRLVLRVIIGLLLVLGFMFGASGLLPTTDIFLRTIRYFVVALLGVFIWPLIFKKANL